MYRKTFWVTALIAVVPTAAVAVLGAVLLWNVDRFGAAAAVAVTGAVACLLAVGAALLAADRRSRALRAAAAADAPERVFPELDALSARVRRQNQLIGESMEELRARQDEFQSLIAGMSEGFVLADADGRVTSWNNAAMVMLGAEAGGVLGLETLCGDETWRKLARSALAGRQDSGLLEIAGRCCRVTMVPNVRAGRLAGVGALLIDVTEHERREAMRREFSSNVSHELKTPLTTIRGNAELMLNGLVAPGDEERFLRTVYEEAGRLLALIDDILRLSRLDEGGMEKERGSVELYAVCEEVADRLRPAAEKAGVTLTLSGEPAVVDGVRVLLFEMIYNLADNAVKYNRPGGSVSVSLHKSPEGVLVTVADTGIGIPPEHLDRIFERFYRVDKSRSRALGGTGLGLSIVKHAAALHGAEVSLDSRPGVGTSVRVCFPPESGAATDGRAGEVQA